MEIKLQIPDERIKDLLCSALEGGSNYWIKSAESPNKSDWPEQVKYWHECPVYGAAVTINVAKEGRGDEHGGKSYTLNRADLERGLQVMAEQFPQHFADFAKENDDATTGDVFLQCCLFGEVVYG
jgi:hypothetical protein